VAISPRDLNLQHYTDSTAHCGRVPCGSTRPGIPRSLPTYWQGLLGFPMAASATHNSTGPPTVYAHVCPRAWRAREEGLCMEWRDKECESRVRRHGRARLLGSTAEGLGFARFHQLSDAGALGGGVRARCRLPTPGGRDWHGLPVPAVMQYERPACHLVFKKSPVLGLQVLLSRGVSEVVGY
jgi:hypothetical protein